MIDALKILVTAGILTAATAAGFTASTRGWGLPGLLDEPVSVREESVMGGKGARFHYFGAGRGHLGGGFHGGK